MLPVSMLTATRFAMPFGHTPPGPIMTIRTRAVRILCSIAAFIVAAIALHAVGLAQRAPAPPAWAYGVQPPGAPAAPGPGGGGVFAQADTSPKKIPGSDQSFTLAQLADSFNIADWFPGDHPTPPAMVMKGKAPDVRACARCHYPNGKGRPENAGISGLPVAYVVQQMTDFRAGLRRSAEARKTNTNFMTTYAKAMTDDEIKTTAEYFASMPWTSWIRVVESATVPKTRLAGGMFTPLDGTDTEPLGARIIEMPEHADRTELRDPRSGFVAYVPTGSIKKGEALVTTGGGKTVACTICHGANLDGMGPVPGLAGRSPSYQARQLFDMQAGTRKGLWAELMKPVVANLTEI